MESSYCVECHSKDGKVCKTVSDSLAKVYRLSNVVEKEGGSVIVTKVESGEVLYETPRRFWRPGVTEKP